MFIRKTYSMSEEAVNELRGIRQMVGLESDSHALRYCIKTAFQEMGKLLLHDGNNRGVVRRAIR